MHCVIGNVHSCTLSKWQCHGLMDDTKEKTDIAVKMFDLNKWEMITKFV